MYGDTVMKMCKYDDIYIRINGVSNIWWPNGRRTDVLDIIPINSSYGDIP